MFSCEEAECRAALATLVRVLERGRLRRHGAGVQRRRGLRPDKQTDRRTDRAHGQPSVGRLRCATSKGRTAACTHVCLHLDSFRLLASAQCCDRQQQAQRLPTTSSQLRVGPNCPLLDLSHSASLAQRLLLAVPHCHLVRSSIPSARFVHSLLAVCSPVRVCSAAAADDSSVSGRRLSAGSLAAPRPQMHSVEWAARAHHRRTDGGRRGQTRSLHRNRITARRPPLGPTVTPLVSIAVRRRVAGPLWWRGRHERVQRVHHTRAAPIAMPDPDTRDETTIAWCHASESGSDGDRSAVRSGGASDPTATLQCRCAPAAAHPFRSDLHSRPLYAMLQSLHSAIASQPIRSGIGAARL